MIQRYKARPEQLSPPPWAIDQYAKDGSKLIRTLVIAGVLVTATGVGLGVTALELQGRDLGIERAWSNTMARLWPAPAPQPERNRAPVLNATPTPAIVTNPPVTTRPLVEAQADTQQVAPATPSTKLPSVRLSVENVRAQALTPITLPVETDVTGFGDEVLLRLTGLPEESTLSAGRKLEDNAWLVSATDLDKLELTLPADAPQSIKVQVEAIEQKTGDLAAPMQEMQVRVAAATGNQVITPANATPQVRRNFASASESTRAATPPLAPASEEAVAMRMRGDETLALGDVAGARGFFEKALQMGDASAAGRIGRTYDPVYYKAIGVIGLNPDRKMAERWYAQSAQAGDKDAIEDLKRLTTSN